MLEEIGALAFDNTKITSIIIPASVIYIGYDAFINLNLNPIIYAEATEQPSGWSIDWNPFYIPVYWSYTE